MLANAHVTTTIAVTDIERAKEFYGNNLGLKEIRVPTALKYEVVYQVGNQFVCLYGRPTPSGGTATVCSFEVEDVPGTVKRLQQNGVRFEEYDLPDMGIKTKNGIATMGEFRSAWFKDPDGNILAVGNMLQSVIGKKTPIAKTA